MKKALLIILFLFYNAVFAQHWEWAKLTDTNDWSEIRGIATDNTGNTYVASRVGNDPTIFISKYDSAGEMLWTKNPIGTGFPNGIAIDNFGFIYVTGGYKSSLIFGSDTLISQTYMDMFLAKYDSIGNIIWVKSTAFARGQRGICNY